MVQPLDEIITLILDRLNILDLCRMMLVCKQWNSILNSTKALWRIVDIHEDSTSDLAHQYSFHRHILEVASDNSDHTLEVYRNSTSLRRNSPFPIFSLLQLSKSTLREVEVRIGEHHLPKEWKHPGNILQFFKDFGSLEWLNLSAEKLPQRKSIEKGRLACLGWDEPYYEDDADYVPIGDVEWLSHLSVLHYRDLEAWAALPDNLLDILEVCSQHLVELKFFTGGRDRERANSTTVELSLLETMTIEKRIHRGNLDCVEAPNLKELKSVAPTFVNVPFRNLINLGLIVDLYESDGDVVEELHQCMVEAVELNKDTLRELQIYPDSSEDFLSIDPLLLHLNLKTDPPLVHSCPNLSSIMIARDENSDAEHNDKVYSEQVLAEMLLSRRLASKSSSPDQEMEVVCSNMTLYLQGDHISDFREAEEQVLARFTPSEREMAGKAEVKTLEEWKGKDW